MALKKIVLWVLVILWGTGGFAETPLENKIKQEIRKQGLKSKYFGIWVKGPSLSASINSEKLFTPASLSKIPTALATLSKFKMNHRYKTWIYHDGIIQGETLKGNLYLKGGGDPSLVTESLWLMVEKLRREKFTKIEGQVFVDESYFDSDYYSNGRQKKRVDRAYDAPVSGLSFNWNSVTVFVRPGKKKGDPVQVFVDPPLDYVKVKNLAKTQKGSKNHKLRVSRQSTDDHEVVTVSGLMGLASDEKAFYKSITRPALWAGQHFKYFLNRAGILYSGTIQTGLTPTGAKQIVEFDSWELSRIVAALSKFSNNFVAEMLAKHLGKVEGQPGNMQAGMTQINSYLRNQGWSPMDYTLVNPSGFTYKNKMRPDRLGELLEKSKSFFRQSPEFISSLPISGVDGTLKTRMGDPMRERVRAKTGYLGGTVGLAGYLEEKKGATATFVMIYNGPGEQDWTVRALFDRLVRVAYNASQ